MRGILKSGKPGAAMEWFDEIMGEHKEKRFFRDDLFYETQWWTSVRMDKLQMFALLQARTNHRGYKLIETGNHRNVLSFAGEKEARLYFNPVVISQEEAINEAQKAARERWDKYGELG